MRSLKILLIFLSSSVVILCQGKQGIYGEVTPFKIVGQRTLELSSFYFSSDMKGQASLVLIIDKDCNLLNFAIIKITVTDEKEENVFGYFDPDVFKKLSDNSFDIFEKDYYPGYLGSFYVKLKDLVKNLNIEYSSDKKDLKDVNQIGMVIRVE